MNSLKPLAPVFALIAILVAALLTIQLMISFNLAAILVPKPEDTAAMFVNELAAHEISGASNQLSDDLKNEFSSTELEKLADSLNNINGGVIQANGTSAEKTGKGDGAKASAKIEITFQNGKTQSLSFPLSQQNGVWSLISISPLVEFLNTK